MDFIKRERIYIWMLIFILSINLLSMARIGKKEPEGNKSLSSASFRDIGVTEQRIKLFFESKKPSAVFFKYGFFAGFFIFFAGMIMNLFFIFGKKKIILKKNSENMPAPWSMADVLRVVIIAVFSGYMLGAISGIISKQVYFKVDVNLGMILGTFFIDAAAAIAVFYFVRVKYREKISSLGIAGAGFCKNILSGITAYIFILPVLISALILSAMFLNAIGYKFPAQPVFDMFFEEKRNNVILFLTIFVSILGPMAEEVFFRGFLYNAVKKRFGILSGVLLSAALFSALHANIAAFVPIMILGILMAFLYETTGSLVAPIAVHILHNSIIVGFVFFIKELAG